MNVPRFIVIGKEGVGKSQLISSLTGKDAGGSNIRGSTISSESYSGNRFDFVDTPGIVFDSDSETTRTAIASMQGDDSILLVVRATSMDEDLEYLFSLVKAKKGAIIVTNWDRVANSKNVAIIEQLERDLGMPVIALDARRITEFQKSRIGKTLENPCTFSNKTFHTGISLRPKSTVLEKRHMGIVIGMASLLAPSILSVAGANYFAGLVHPIVADLMAEPVERLEALLLPPLLTYILVGEYGLFSMGPFLFVWAAPTITIYSLLLGVYKSTGLLDRTSLAIHPLVRRIGVSGRDVTRIVMGFGCNVPAVISSRSCSGCSRGTTVSAISFGSACSYQFGATIAVLAASGMPWLVVPFLIYLAGTTVVYSRLVSTRKNRSKLGMPVIDGQVFFERPTFSSTWRESRQSITQFFRTALPIFFAITFVASLLNWTGVIALLAGELGLIMSLFNLPGDSALAIMFGSIRKDGLLLLAEPGMADSLSALQVLTGVYLAGTLLPCIVTFLTIVREMSWKFAVRMAAKQIIATVAFTLLLAHSDKLWNAFLQI